MANAIKMLQDDHNSVKMLFKQLPTIKAGSKDEEEKAALHIISLLETHTSLEAELVYPVLADANSELIKHAEDEHEEASSILAEIKKMPAGPEMRDAVSRLQVVVEAHVAEEEETVFPLLTEVLGVAGLEDLGREMMSRQQELMQDADETTGAASAGMPKNVYPKL